MSNSNRQRSKTSRALWNRLIKLAPKSVDVRDASVGTYDVNKYSIRVEGRDNDDIVSMYKSFLELLRNDGWTVEAGQYGLTNLSHAEVSTAGAYIGAPYYSPETYHLAYFDIGINL